jgi:hypothetical protein
MKIKRIITLTASAVFLSISSFSQIGIGTIIPDASAELDLTSTTQGFLVPRMTNAEKNLITSPAAGLQVWCTDCGYSGEAQVYNGSSWTNLIGGTVSSTIVNCTGVSTAVVNVTTSTGKTWMDRNLGATQVATYMWEANAYGDLYQWGRRTDGHQCRTSSTTGTISSVDQPANGFFILTTNSSPYDWRSPQNANLWQGVNGTNNPCPSGYRLPTEAEFVAERGSWTSPDRDGAFGSPLKLPTAGSRLFDTGGYVFFMHGGGGSYWTSTVIGIYSKRLEILSIGSDIYQDARASGNSVRCIKHY